MLAGLISARPRHLQVSTNMLTGLISGPIPVTYKLVS
eukprot:gene27156-biopygen17703